MAKEAAMTTTAVLFDIDNTLTTSSSAHYRAFQESIKTVFAINPHGSKVSFHGRSDRWIAAEIARSRGVSEDIIAGRLQQCLDMMIDLHARNLAEDSAALMPGIPELLDLLTRRGSMLGLITGNLETIAWRKLGRVGIDSFFAFGGFGSDSVERPEMLAFAIERARKRGFTGGKESIIAIGDTPLDIDAAHKNGVRCIGVATGVFSAQMLLDAGADLVVKDLTCHDEIFALCG